MNEDAMRLYTSTGTRRSIETLNAMNVGLLMSEVWRDPGKWPCFALDNGCYAAFSHGAEWDPSTFLRHLSRCRDKGLRPDFVVIPDRPLSKDSLDFSKKWYPVLKTMYPDFPYYLAVQDGMAPEDVEDIDGIQGIFVGGSMDWKLESMKAWIDYAHSRGMGCHVGRIGPIQRMLMCELAGADSIDSTTWVQRRGGIEKYIGGYMAQTKIEEHTGVSE